MIRFVSAMAACASVLSGSLDISAVALAQPHLPTERQVDVCVSVDYKGTTENRTNFGQSDQRILVAYRYNPLIAMTWSKARDSVQILANLDKRQNPQWKEEWRPYVEERLAWLADDENRREMAKVAPSFWGLGHKRSASLIHDAPFYSSPSEDCGSKYSPPVHEGEFALFREQRVPRVRGDLCADIPLIVMEGITKPQIAAFYQSALSSPDGVSLQDLLRPNGSRYLGDSFVTDMAKVMAIRELQCGTSAQSLDVIFERQDRPMRMPMRELDQAALSSALSLSIRVKNDRLVAEVIETSREARSAEATVAQVKEKSKRAMEKEAGAELRFSIGTLLLFGSIAVVGARAQTQCESPFVNLNSSRDC